MLVGLDCDGVLFDFVGHLRNTLALPADWEPRDMNCFVGMTPIRLRAAQAAMLAPGFAASMPLYSGARDEVMRLARAGVEFCYVTKPCRGSATWCYDRAEAIRRELPEAPIVFTSRKDLTRCDVLIDDDPSHADLFRGHFLCIGRPWNSGGVTLTQAIDWVVARKERGFYDR